MMQKRQRSSTPASPLSLPALLGPRLWEQKLPIEPNTDPPSVKEELVYELLHELDPHKSMGTDNIHPRVLREMADIIARPLSIIFEKSWRMGDVPEDWRKAMLPLSTRRARERFCVTIGPSALLQSLGKLWNESSWGPSQVK